VAQEQSVKKPGGPAGRPGGRPSGPSLLPLLKPYRGLGGTILILTVGANLLNLVVPRLMARGVDAFATKRLVTTDLVFEFAAVTLGIFVLTYLQNVAQTLAAERVARDLRTQIVARLAMQDVSFIQQTTTATLLTNLTSDVDGVKLFVSQAFGSIIASIVLIIGAAILLLSINWKLGLAVLAVFACFAAIERRRGAVERTVVLDAKPARIAAGEDRRAGGRATRRDIPARAHRPLAGEPIEVGCGNVGTTGKPAVADAEVIHEDHDDIG
jgi:ABC-type multidrug transport system fused ATPase/permease subunit